MQHTKLRQNKTGFPISYINKYDDKANDACKMNYQLLQQSIANKELGKVRQVENNSNEQTWKADYLLAVEKEEMHLNRKRHKNKETAWLNNLIYTASTKGPKHCQLVLFSPIIMGSYWVIDCIIAQLFGRSY